MKKKRMNLYSITQKQKRGNTFKDTINQIRNNFSFTSNTISKDQIFLLFCCFYSFFFLPNIPSLAKDILFLYFK